MPDATKDGRGLSRILRRGLVRRSSRKHYCQGCQDCTLRHVISLRGQHHGRLSVYHRRRCWDNRQ